MKIEEIGIVFLPLHMQVKLRTKIWWTVVDDAVKQLRHNNACSLDVVNDILDAIGDVVDVLGSDSAD